jgi:hypothetical protein
MTRPRGCVSPPASAARGPRRRARGGWGARRRGHRPRAAGIAARTDCVVPSECRLGVDAEVPARVHDREEVVTQLGLDRRPIAPGHGLAKLRRLLVEFLEHPARLAPVEAGGRGLLADPGRPQQRRKGGRDAVEGALAGRATRRLLRRLDLRPVLHHRRGVVGHDAAVAEHVRVPADEFVGDRRRDVGDVERPGLFPNARLEDHLQEEIAEFLAVLAARPRSPSPRGPHRSPRAGTAAASPTSARGPTDSHPGCAGGP